MRPSCFKKIPFCKTDYLTRGENGFVVDGCGVVVEDLGVPGGGETGLVGRIAEEEGGLRPREGGAFDLGEGEEILGGCNAGDCEVYGPF